MIVRKDIKCLNEKELNDLINAIKILYDNGIMDKFAHLHAEYWPVTHKGSEAVFWHFWFINEFEKELRKINGDITLPYWVTIYIVELTITHTIHHP